MKNYISRILIALTILSGIYIASPDYVSACSPSYNTAAPKLDLGDFKYNNDGSITGFVLLDSTNLKNVEIQFLDSTSSKKYHFSINTQNAKKDKIIKANKIGSVEIVDLQLYRVDVNFSSKDLELPVGEYEVKLFATSTLTFCGHPITTSTTAARMNVENTYYKLWEEKNNIELNHDFTIQFNDEVNEDTLKNHIYVIHNVNELVEGIKVILNEDKKSVIVKSPKVGYIPGEDYFLYIDNGIQSVSEKSINQSIKMKFTTVPSYNLQVGNTYQGTVYRNVDDHYIVTITSFNANTGEIKAELKWKNKNQNTYLLEGKISGDELVFQEISSDGFIINGSLATYSLKFNPNMNRYEGTRIYKGFSPISWENKITEQTVLFNDVINPEPIIFNEKENLVIVNPKVTYQDVYEYIVNTLKKDFLFYRKMQSNDFSSSNVDRLSKLLLSVESKNERKFFEVTGKDVSEIQIQASENKIYIPNTQKIAIQDVMDKLSEWSSQQDEEVNKISVWERYTNKDILFDENTIIVTVEYTGGPGLTFTYYNVQQQP